MMIYNWINDSKKRFYKITLEVQGNDLVAVRYNWGSCVSRRGGIKNDLCTRQEAESVIEKMLKRRKSRGYQLITPLVN